MLWMWTTGPPSVDRSPGSVDRLGTGVDNVWTRWVLAVARRQAVATGLPVSEEPRGQVSIERACGIGPIGWRRSPATTQCADARPTAALRARCAPRPRFVRDACPRRRSLSDAREAVIRQHAAGLRRRSERNPSRDERDSGRSSSRALARERLRVDERSRGVHLSELELKETPPGPRSLGRGYAAWAEGDAAWAPQPGPKSARFADYPLAPSGALSLPGAARAVRGAGTPRPGRCRCREGRASRHRSATGTTGRCRRGRQRPRARAGR